MKRCASLFLAAVLASLTAGAVEPGVKVSVLDNAVLCVRATHVPEDVPDQIRAAAVPQHLAGAVLDLRFADAAAGNAAGYFIHRKLPLVVLVNSQTSGTAAALATELRQSAAAILIGSTNVPADSASGELKPDIVVDVSAAEEKKFQEDPFLRTAESLDGLQTTNLLAFVDHTSEADLVRKHIKDGDDDGEPEAPRVEPKQPVVRDPALARAIDLLEAVAALNR
jgi:hypothetical protein